ncbi:restriction endonuclease subunit S [Aggregatibacter kilianii]|uniref:restriction endonuclease subunit S n=1 Tax=Aggregatibacter kilianii TaxID=2025884 RepID=UPI0028D537F2|nr:restriction endonuclease subunit S [Aggregatibacter kilianii]
MNKQQEPSLRFQGFMETWEEKTLNDVSEVFEYGLNAQAVNFDGVHKYIRITDIDDESRQFLQENVTSPDVDFSKADNYKLQKGDLLFARTGASVGKSYLYNENDGLVYFAGFLIRAKLKKEFDAQFIFQNTLTNHFNRFVTLTSQRSGQPGINSKEYSEFEFLAPSLPEQTHLGLFFRRLDSQIAESRAVLEKSRQLKKAMLAKMYPANGEKIPKIRFKGFEGEWEWKKLGEIGELYQPRTITGTDLTFTGYPVFGANGYIGFYGEANHFEDQVTISARGEGTGTANYVTAPVWITGNSMVINVDCNNEIDKNFLFALLTAMSLKKYVTGGAQPQLTREVLEKISLKIPTLPEQTAIGNFFRQLDETITLQSAEIEKLNQLKKGLLAAMLV